MLCLLHSLVWSRETVHLPQTNLLFIMFDDLRPELSIYGREWMNTPAFERLADRGVVFDLAVSQVSACNPSRNSLLSGMRPDTLGSYNAQTNHGSHKLLPHYLVNAGYKTAAYGKLRHFEEWDSSLWTEEYYEGSLYRQQSINTTVMPDQHLREELYTDHDFATRAIQGLRNLSSQNEYYMAAVGFKLPHSPLHVPQSYFDAYKEQQGAWKEAEESLRVYPPTAPFVGYSRGQGQEYHYLDGSDSAGLRKERIGDPAVPLSTRLYAELRQGYAAAVSFADAQMGRILDVVDELNLWNNLTVVVTSDHGVHLGEKGMYDRSSLFDETGRVPLVIAHPASPYKKSHVYEPVELVDVFPTVLDLISSPHIRTKSIMHAHSRAAKHDGGSGGGGGAKHSRQSIRKREGGRHEQLGGKSLAPLIVGSKYRLSLQRGGTGGGRGTHSASHRHSLHIGGHRAGFAVTQALRCIPATHRQYDPRVSSGSTKDTPASTTSGLALTWGDCDVNNKTEGALADQTTVMGYSLRTIDFRYTLWLHFNRVDNLIEWGRGLVAEELYDHREDGGDSLGKGELHNLLANSVSDTTKAQYKEVAGQQRNLLVGFLQKKVTFRKHLLSHWEHDAAYEAHEADKQAFNLKYLVVDGGEHEAGSEVPHKKLTRKEEKKLREFIRENAAHERL